MTDILNESLSIAATIAENEYNSYTDKDSFLSTMRSEFLACHSDVIGKDATKIWDSKEVQEWLHAEYPEVFKA